MGNLPAQILDGPFSLQLPGWLLRDASLAVCDRASDVDEAKMLLDMFGLVEQPPGTYSRSDDEIIANGEVCKRGHPQNRRNALKRLGERSVRCRACNSERGH